MRRMSRRERGGLSWLRREMALERGFVVVCPQT